MLRNRTIAHSLSRRGALSSHSRVWQRRRTPPTPPKLPGKVDVVQKLNAPLPLEQAFRDEYGHPVRLGDYFKSGRPVLLNFVYYRCPMLCPTVLESLTNTLTEMRGDVGKDFDIITVSIDPRDMPKTAAERKAKYVKRYGRPSANDGWHFLTSYDSAIRRLTDAVGFEYAYDEQHDQFAHGTALIVVTPDGHVSRYFNGFEYKARDLRLGLVEASAGKIAHSHRSGPASLLPLRPLHREIQRHGHERRARRRGLDDARPRWIHLHHASRGAPPLRNAGELRTTRNADR